MVHDWWTAAKTGKLTCIRCGLVPECGQHSIELDDLHPNALCFGSYELTADIVQQALEETGHTLWFSPYEAIPWQETFGGRTRKSVKYREFPLTGIVAIWLGENGNLIIWSDDTVTFTHPSTHRTTPAADLEPIYDHDCDQKSVPRNPTENTGWGEGRLFWIESDSSRLVSFWGSLNNFERDLIQNRVFVILEACFILGQQKPAQKQLPFKLLDMSIAD